MNITKEYEIFNYNLINSYDITEIINIVSDFDKEWNLNTYRQNQDDPTHRNTESYLVNAALPGWVPGKPILVVKQCENEKLWELLQPIFEDMEKHHDGKLASAMIVKLFSDKDVLPHKDEGSEYFGAIRRHHMAIKTNPEATFFVDNTAKHMAVGELWEINNNKTHYAINSGADVRIHLIADVIPNKYL
jgi:hypothetical protein